MQKNIYIQKVQMKMKKVTVQKIYNIQEMKMKKVTKIKLYI